MAYHVTTTDWETDPTIYIPPLAAYAALALPHGAPYDIFVRPIRINDTSTIAHWDLGCTRSLIPWALAKTVGAPIDQTRTYALSTANGETCSLGTMVLTISLTPECSVEHTFIVVADTPIVLVGGDILADVFSAVHFSRAKEFHLQDEHGGLHFVGAHDPDPWGDSEPFHYRPLTEKQGSSPMSAFFVSANTTPQTKLLEDLSHREDEDLIQEELTVKHSPYLQTILASNEDVFVTSDSQASKYPECPAQRPWDFDVQLITPAPKVAFSRPHSGDPVQTAFFARWLKGMTSSGAHKGARWVNAISRAEGEVYYVAPARAIKKHDGDYSGPMETWDMRVIVDYREVNANSALPGRTSCPHISTLLNDISQTRYKTKMDLRHGFFNVGIKNDKTRRCFAFSTPQGIFLPHVMPMGAKGSPDALMNMMGSIFDTLVAEGVMFIYLDDLVIGTNTIEQHWRVLKKVLALAKQYNLSFKRSKCEFLRLEIQFLGYTVAYQTLKPGRRIADAIQAIRVPTTKAEVKSFVAMCNYFRCFIPNFGRIAAPLTDMQRGKTTPFEWGPRQQTAYLALKQALSTDPVLRPFQFGLPTVTVSDASTEGAGAVLLQQAHPEAAYHACDFWSTRWPASIAKHSITELETRALVEPIDGPWRHFLKFQEFTAFTDHSACTYLLTKPDKSLSKHDERSKVKLSSYALKAIQHVPGKHNEVADTLSRLTNRYTHSIFVLDAYAGCGTFLRALDQTLPLHVSIVYVAVEQDPMARAVISNIVTRINTTRPGRVAQCPHLPLELFPFQLGHDMNQLDLAQVASLVSQYEDSCCATGPPCQPFSAANISRQGFVDPRAGFHVIHALITIAKFRFWYVENVVLSSEDEELVNDLFQCSPVTLQAADLGPASRLRMVWANFAIEQPTQTDKELYGFLWQDILQGDYEALRPKAPTLMASKNSYSDRRGETLVRHIGDGTRRRMTSHEKESCIGLEQGDITTVINDYWDVHRLVGNAFPVPCQRHCLRFAVRLLSMTRPGHSETPHAAFAVADTPLDFTPTILAMAARDKTYQSLLQSMTTNTDIYPHQRDGLIIHEPHRILVPDNTTLQNKLVDHFHQILGHAGSKKILPALKDQFYWKGMDAQVKQICQTCPSCQLTKKGALAKATISTWTVDERPWQTVHVDITMLYRGLPADSISSALVLVDRFTRYCVLIPCKHALTAPEVISLLEQHFFCHYGIPERIISDNGPPFNSTLWDQVLELLGTRKGHTTVYRPQENGLVERMNRTVKSVLSTMVEDLQLKGIDNVLSLLPWVMWSINSTENGTLGMSPFEALTFTKPHIPHSFFQKPESQLRDPQQLQFTRLEQLASTWRHVRTKLEKWNAKIVQDRGETNVYSPSNGDAVYVHRRRAGQPLNIDETDFTGPYPVIATFGNQALLGQVPDTPTGEAMVHVDRLKPAQTRPAQKQPNSDGTWNYTKVLFRDFSTLVTQSYPSLMVVWDSGQTTTELEQGDEGRTYRTNHPLPFLQKGITSTNVDQVFQYQTAVLQWKYPILVNTAPLAAASLTKATPRRKQPTPQLALMRWVVTMDNVIGLVIDYDEKDATGPAWLVAWNDGQQTWHTDSFLQEHSYGILADDKSKYLSASNRRQLKNLRGRNSLPLTTWLRHNPTSNLRSRREIPSQRNNARK